MSDEAADVPDGTAPRVLVVCRHNAGRSQMAAAFLAGLRPDWEVTSAGVGPDLRGDTVPASVVEVLAEVAVALDPATPRRLLTPEGCERADLVVMIVEPELWPVWLPTGKVLFWDIADPRGRPVEELRAARDVLRSRCLRLADAVPAGGSATLTAAKLPGDAWLTPPPRDRP